MVEHKETKGDMDWRKTLGWVKSTYSIRNRYFPVVLPEKN